MSKESKGWICPKCGIALAPWMSFCPFCSRIGERRVDEGESVVQPPDPNIKPPEFEEVSEGEAPDPLGWAANKLSLKRKIEEVMDKAKKSKREVIYRSIL